MNSDLGVKLYKQYPKILLYLGLKFQINKSLERPCEGDDGQTKIQKNNT